MKTDISKSILRGRREIIGTDTETCYCKETYSDNMGIRNCDNTRT